MYNVLYSVFALFVTVAASHATGNEQVVMEVHYHGEMNYHGASSHVQKPDVTYEWAEVGIEFLKERRQTSIAGNPQPNDVLTEDQVALIKSLGLWQDALEIGAIMESNLHKAHAAKGHVHKLVRRASVHASGFTGHHALDGSLSAKGWAKPPAKPQIDCSAGKTCAPECCAKICTAIKKCGRANYRETHDCEVTVERCPAWSELLAGGKYEACLEGLCAYAKRECRWGDRGLRLPQACLAYANVSTAETKEADAAHGNSDTKVSLMEERRTLTNEASSLADGLDSSLGDKCHPN